MGPWDASFTRAFSLQSKYVLSGKTLSTDADMQMILTLNINILLDKDVLINVRRNRILCYVSLCPGHTFLVWIRAFIKYIEKYGTRWRNLEMNKTILQGSKGSVFLQYYSLNLSSFWRS